MSTYLRKIHAVLLTGAMCLTILGGCAASDSGQKPQQNPSENNTETADDSAQKENDAQTDSLGGFSLQDITGNTFTDQIFQEYELTMVNVFTTWCSPCINEIPDLEKLHVQMADKNVNIIGIVLDALGEDGKVSEEAVEKAKLLAERTGATYPFLIPDADGLNGRLKGIEAVPETFFVDQNGNLTGESYLGSHSLEDWQEIVEKELARSKGEQP